MEVLNDQLHKEIQIYKNKMLLKMISVDSMENFYETVSSYSNSRGLSYFMEYTYLLRNPKGFSRINVCLRA